jgi:hypothetical protein
VVTVTVVGGGRGVLVGLCVGKSDGFREEERVGDDVGSRVGAYGHA